MDSKTLEHDILKPLVSAWSAKLEAAKEAKSAWKEVADECLMFYAQSSQAMWDPEYSKKFWKNVKLPRFRITMNKAFEFVAIYLPNLMWEVPHRTVKSKKVAAIPPELFGMDEQGQMAYQQFLQGMEMEKARDKTIANFMQSWLNYTPMEMPGGGLEGHSERATVDALIKGRGCLSTRNYTMPGSTRTLTGSFYVDPYDVFIDPDFNNVDECRWMAIRHVEPHYEVEARFGLEKNVLKNKASMETSWTFSELSTDPMSASLRNSGQTSDNIVWYEIFSKAGSGIRQTNSDEKIKNHMEKVVGQYAYIAICPDVPWPLNMPVDKLFKGATDDEVQLAMSWPVPFWADNKWPVEFLDFYLDPHSAWPVAPLAPGLGELKLMNFLISWMAGRVWKSSRDFWSVAGPHVEHYRDYLENGEDQQVIPVPYGVDDVSKALSVLQQPETRQDMSRLIAFVSDNFDKRVGLTPFAYGLNQDGTQNRTAEETAFKAKAVSTRPEYMQKKVVKWQGNVAKSEAFVTRMFVRGRDVEPLLGSQGAMIWDQVVTSTDVELVTRQFEYTIEASSIRRPNRDRDIANFQQIAGLFMPVMQQYGASTGDYGPFNAIMAKWAEYHDADLDDAMLPPPAEPDPQQMELQSRMQAAEVSKAEAEVQKLMIEAQAAAASAQPDPVMAQMEAMKAQLAMEADAAKASQEIEIGQAKSLSELLQGQAKHDMMMRQGEELHRQKLIQSMRQGQ